MPAPKEITDALRVAFRAHVLGSDILLDCDLPQARVQTDRWGRVTPQGIKIPLPLTHSLLALVVGARRPTVTSAVRSLARAGRLKPCPRSQWLLCGGPPEELREMHEHAARYDCLAPLEVRWPR